MAQTPSPGTFLRAGRVSIRVASPRGEEPAKAPSMVSTDELREIYRWFTRMTPNVPKPYEGHHKRLLKALAEYGGALKTAVPEEVLEF